VRKFVLTIDTNSINVRQADENLNALEEWHKKSAVEIVKTDVMDTEFQKAAPHRRDVFMAKSSQYREDTGEGHYDNSRYDHALYGPLENYPLEAVRRILFPNFDELTEDEKERARRDAMHLATHYRHRRDIFITTDKHFLINRDSLKSRFGIVILRPDECVSLLHSEFAKLQEDHS
jgi:hypothetical protein